MDKIVTSNHPDADQAVSEFFKHGWHHDPSLMRHYWYMLWRDHGPRVSFKYEFNNRGVHTVNCPCCGEFVDEEVQALCHKCGATPGKDEHDPFHMEGTTWCRPTTAAEDRFLRLARNRVVIPPVSVAV